MLEVDGLSVRYGAFEAVHGVSLSVRSGSLVGVVGANGAGKSSIINAVSGLLPYVGEVRFDGQELRGVAPWDIARLGVVQVPEGRSLFGEMTVEENLLVAAQYGQAWSVHEETLAQVRALFPRLEERRHQVASTLSGGEQQMLAIGRALMGRPRLLLMDEISLGLAPVAVLDMFKAVERLKARGMTIVLVEQNVRHCLGIADYAYVLENGKIVLSGPGRSLLEDSAATDAYLGLRRAASERI